MTAYQAGAANLTSRVMHVVVDGPHGSYSTQVDGTAACGQPVLVRPTTVTARHWLCMKCRRTLGWGPNRTLQQMQDGAR